MSTKIGIAFVKGGIIPAAIMNKDKDVRVPPHEAIEVPESYGQHLIDDKFAYAKDVDKKGSGKTSKSAKGKEPDAAKIAAAEQAVTDAEKELAAAEGDLAKEALAREKLADAKSVLNEIKG